MWLELQVFGFRALWSPYFFTFVVCLGIAYYLITGPYRHKFGGNAKPTIGQQVAFYLALVLLYILKGSPIDLLTHIMLSFHMAQMALLYLIFPILIIKGLPVWIWEKVVLNSVLYPFFNFVSNPIISILSFNGLFSLYHMPAIFDFTKSSIIAHTASTIILLIAAFIMWFPVMSPLKEFDRLKPLVKIFYVFGNGVLITPACALIIFSDVPLFAAYSATGAWVQALSLCVPGDVLAGMNFGISGQRCFRRYLF
ncbi:cytochrome c oxidase assembly factor CtaG [Paracerasibacillus soli]|uniref:Cytochrome c oxidase assembly factor CtaG n=1 Tax=Paracerasibacillus soli TaxID=480284 RepID=A0ABU5CP00_9BACI|nr:cytochrome c oxidase assembly factor CtaG [Virgibacillus soli]MDY0408076.1 cytochrome c oxidase assembly factor CtaG [Virgibacillus soli]